MKKITIALLAAVISTSSFALGTTTTSGNVSEVKHPEWKKEWKQQQAAKAVGMTEYLLKPIEMEKLVQVLLQTMV